MLFLKFALVFTGIFLAMHVALSLVLTSFHLPLRSSGSMASKRARSKNTNGSAIGVAIERVSASLPIYQDSKVIVDKNINLKWQEINDEFVGTFGDDLRDYQVYMNIHKSGLYRIA